MHPLGLKGTEGYLIIFFLPKSELLNKTAFTVHTFKCLNNFPLDYKLRIYGITQQGHVWKEILETEFQQ